jgi:hypothetical protein
MKILKYGYFGEDNAQQIFLENYLTQLPDYLNLQGIIAFEKDATFKLIGKDKPTVLKLFAEAVQKGLAHYQQDVFFVGIDSDDDEHGKLHSQMVQKLFPAFRHQTFIFIPVQCIEHWLLYLKYKKEHPNSNKNEVYERVARPDAKERMYGSRRTVAVNQAKVVAKFTQNMEIEWLGNRSDSFRHFHFQLIDFLKKADFETA